MINENLDTNVSEEEELVDNEAENEFTGTDEEESGEESEVEDSENLSGDDGEDERTLRAKAQRDRLAKEIADLKAEKSRLKKDGEESGQESQVATNSELVERTYLAANGIKDKDVQNEVMRLAKKFDISVDEAMDDADISARATALLKKKEASKALAKGTGGASASKKTPSYYANYFKQHGDFPAGTTTDMIAKATDILAKE